MILIKNGTVITMDPSRSIFERGTVAIGEDGRIAAVGAEADTLPDEFDEVIDATGMIVLPGLINLHQHHWYNLFKGLAGGMLLEEWVSKLLLPAVGELTAEDLRVSAYLAAMEMIRTGTTCCLNHSVTTTMAAEVAATIEPMAEVGFRQVFAKDFRCRTPAFENHPHDPEAAASYIGELVERWDGAEDGLIRMALAVESNAHWILAGMSTEELIRRAYRLACERDLKITNHSSGGTLSLDFGYLHGIRQTGRSDVLYLAEMGVLDWRWLLIHGIHFTDTDIKLVKETGCHVVYAPTSEAIRGGGVGPWVKLTRAGVNCSLGTDGPMVDYSVDMVEQMKACTLIQNATHMDPNAMPLERSLEMATINAAHALGMENEIGSLEVGKRADIAIFDIRGPHNQVAHNPVAGLICTGRGADAHTVFINGRPVLQDGRLTQGPEVSSVIEEATERGRAIATKIGAIEWAKPQWPERLGV